VLDRAERGERRIELAPLVMIGVYVAGLAMACRARW
jgi:hypothetical protein